MVKFKAGKEMKAKVMKLSQTISADGAAPAASRPRRPRLKLRRRPELVRPDFRHRAGSDLANEMRITDAVALFANASDRCVALALPPSCYFQISETVCLGIRKR